MDLANLLNANNDGTSPIDRRPSSRQMSISHRADSISSTTPTQSIHSPLINGHLTSTPTPTSLDRPRSAHDSVESTPAPNMKRKREESEQKPKKRRIQEPPLWAHKIPERVHLGRAWHMLAKAHISSTNTPPTASIARAPATISAPAASTGRPPAPNADPFGTTWSNQQPADEVTRMVADFLYQSVTPLMSLLPPENIEIEARLGRITDRDTDERIILGVRAETVMADTPMGRRTVFQSSMSEEEHKYFNEQLNKHLSNNAIYTAGGVGGAPGNKPYERVQEIDSFWQIPRTEVMANIPPHLHAHLLGPGNSPVRIRLSNAWTGSSPAGGPPEERACIIKRRVSHLDVYNPNWSFDWRVSVNIEYQYTGSRSGIEPAMEINNVRARDRAKNRLKYFYPVCDIDFTKVTTVPSGERPGTNLSWEENMHEIEVELHSKALYEQLRLLSSGGEGNRYEDLVKMLTANVRLLTRARKA